LMAAILTGDPEPLPSSIPESIQKVVARALDKEATQRYQSAANMRGALRDIRQPFMPSGVESTVIGDFPSPPYSRQIEETAQNPSTVTVPAKNKPSKSTSLIAVLVLLLVIGLLGTFYAISSRVNKTSAVSEVTTASGLKYVDLVEGNGESPKPGQTITVNYRGALENGTEFNNTYITGKPVSFQIGVGKLIRGWDEGLMTMKIGGKRKLIVSPNLAYGPRGSPPTIPPNATLIFEVEMLGIK